MHYVLHGYFVHLIYSLRSYYTTDYLWDFLECLNFKEWEEKKREN